MWWVFSSTPASAHRMPVAPTLQVVTTKNDSRHHGVSPGGCDLPVENAALPVLQPSSASACRFRGRSPLNLAVSSPAGHQQSPECDQGESPTTSPGPDRLPSGKSCHRDNQKLSPAHGNGPSSQDSRLKNQNQCPTIQTHDHCSGNYSLLGLGWVLFCF